MVRPAAPFLDSIARLPCLSQDVLYFFRMSILLWRGKLLSNRNSSLSKELSMRWNRLRKLMYVALCGGTLLQATGCDAIIESLVVNLASSFVLNALLSGLVV